MHNTSSLIFGWLLQVHEHSTAPHTQYFWQKPRSQLTLLAAFGTDVRLSFFDLDEYLVLPQAGTIIDGQCMGKLLLEGAPAMSFPRHSARSCKQRPELDCWKDGKALPETTGLDIVLERCPCQFHKPLVRPERVVTLSVHFVWAWGAKIPVVPSQCGFLLHLHALVHERRHLMPHHMPNHHFVAGTWVLPKEQGSGLLLHHDGQNMVDDFYNTTFCSNVRKLSQQQPRRHIISAC